MRITLIQLAYDDHETLTERTERVAAMVRQQAAETGPDLMVLPELWSAGGFDYRGWAVRAQTVDGQVAQAMATAAREAGVMLHAGSIVEHPADGERGPEGKELWNTSLVLDAQGRLLTTYRKIHRFGFGSGEPRLMEAGEDLRSVDVPTGDADGTRSLQAGLSTCYDLRFPELYRAQLDAGAQMFLVPSAWPMARVAHWSLFARARAVENQCLVVACNTAGTHARTEMGGRSVVVGPGGEVLAEAGTGQEVLTADVDPGCVAAARSAFPVLQDRRLPGGEGPLARAAPGAVAGDD